MTEKGEGEGSSSTQSPAEATTATTATTTGEQQLQSQDDDGPPPISEVIDHSNDPNALNKAKELKDQGNVELAKGHFLQAIDFYSRGLEYDSTNAILLSNRALAYIKIENYGLAKLDADAAIISDPNYPKGYYRRASSNFALNHYKLARKDFRAVCKLRPKDKDARSKLNECEKAVREEAFCKAIEAEQTAPLSASYDPSKIDISATYDGPHPSPDGNHLIDMELEKSYFTPGQLPLDFVMQSVTTFQNQKLVHKRYVARMLLSCREYFANLSSLMEIQIPTESPPPREEDGDEDPASAQDNNIKPPRLTVCGDTHGQYYDVLNIFKMNGYPHRNNPYLFNGDFVDRGSFSLEVITTFLLFKLYDPSCIYLTRGNHETKNMNRIYGFEGEVKAKYDDKIFQLVRICI